MESVERAIIAFFRSFESHEDHPQEPLESFWRDRISHVVQTCGFPGSDNPSEYRHIVNAVLDSGGPVIGVSDSMLGIRRTPSRVAHAALQLHVMLLILSADGRVERVDETRVRRMVCAAWRALEGERRRRGAPRARAPMTSTPIYQWEPGSDVPILNGVPLDSRDTARHGRVGVMIREILAGVPRQTTSAQRDEATFVMWAWGDMTETSSSSHADALKSELQTVCGRLQAMMADIDADRETDPNLSSSERERHEDQDEIEVLPEVYQELYHDLTSTRAMAAAWRELGHDEDSLWRPLRFYEEFLGQGCHAPTSPAELEFMIGYLQWQARQADQPTSEDQLRDWLAGVLEIHREMGGSTRRSWDRRSRTAADNRRMQGFLEGARRDVVADLGPGSSSILETSVRARRLGLPSSFTSGTYTEIYRDLEAMRVAHGIYSRNLPGEPSPSFRAIWPMVPGLGDARPASAAELEFLMHYVEWQARRPEREQPRNTDQLHQRMVSLLERLYRPTGGRTTHPWEIEPPGRSQGYRLDHRQQVVAMATSQDPARDDNQTDWVLLPRAPVEWEELVEGQVNRSQRNGGTGNSEMLHHRDTLQPPDLLLRSSRNGHEDRAVRDLFAATQARQPIRSSTANGTAQTENAGADSETEERRREERPASAPASHGVAGATSTINGSSTQETSRSRAGARTQ